MPRNFISIVLLALLVTATLWFAQSPPPQLQSSPQASADGLVMSEYFNVINTVQFDSEGLPEHQFRAARVEHQVPTDDSQDQPGRAIMQAPDIRFFEAGNLHWQAQARRGESQMDDEQLWLRDEVKLVQQGVDGGWQITTDSLQIDPSRQYAHTDAPVELRSTGIQSAGVGMKADLAQESIEILADTHTRYDPSL